MSRCIEGTRMDSNAGLEAAFVACKNKIQKHLGASLRILSLVPGIVSTDGLDNDNVHSASIEDIAVDNAQENTENSSDLIVSVASIIDELFNSIKIHDDSNISILPAIVKYVLDLSIINPNICYVVVSHIASLPKPVPFIEICPALFCMTNASLITDLVEQLVILYESDNRNILPVLGAMVELSLPTNLMQRLAKLVENAILIVEENDIPTLFRTILKSLTNSSSGEKTILKLRKSFKNLSDESITLIVEAMWEILPSSLQASTLFLDQIIKEQKVLEGVGLLWPNLLPTLSDVSVLLILITSSSFSGSNLKVKANNLFTIWLINDIFPFDQLETILKLRRANDIWERMTPSIWILCLWLIDNVAKYMLLSDKFCNDINTCKSGLSNLVGTLYSTLPSLHETIINALLNQCYYVPQNHYRGIHSSHLSTVFGVFNDGLVLLAPLGSSHSSSVVESSSNSKSEFLEEKYSRIQANISAVILEHLAVLHKDIGLVILVSINNHLTPCADGRILFPPPVILRKLFRCILYCSGSSPQFESTILILTQKLLVTITQPNLEFLSIIASTRKLSSSSISLTKYNAINSRSQLFRSLCVHSLYSPVAIGIILAHQLIHQRTNHNIEMPVEAHLLLHHQDYRALIEWVVRAFDTLQDDSMVYAIDFFTTCLSHCRVNIRTTTPNSNTTYCSSSSSSSSCTSKNNIFRDVSNSVPVSEYYSSLHDTIKQLWNQFMQSHHIAIISGLTTLDYADNIPSFVIDCSSSDLSYVPANTIDGSNSRPVIWCLARISRQIVENNKKTITTQDISNVNSSLLMDSVLWLVQRASCLHYSLYPPKANSFTTGLQLSVTPELIDIKELLCDANENDSNSQSRASRSRNAPIRNSDVYEAVKNRVFVGKSLWNWTNSVIGGFNGSFVRPMGMTTIVSLRLSWERVLAAAVLLGILQAARHFALVTNNLVASSPTLTELLRILNQINCSRHMLRIAHSDEVRLHSNDISSNGTKRRRENSEKMLVNGKKSMKTMRKQNPVVSSSGIDDSNSIDISLLTHKKVLEKLLSRLTNMIDDNSIHSSLLYLLQQSSLAAITDGGFSLIVTYIYRRLVLDSSSKYGVEAEVGLPSLIYDAFISIDESCCKNEVTTIATSENVILINKKLLTMTNSLVQYIKHCRRGNTPACLADVIDKNLLYALGSPLDLFGSSVLLLCIYMAIDNVFKVISKSNTQADNDGIQDNEETMIYCDELIASQINGAQSDSDFSYPKKMLHLYDVVEKQLLSLQDAVVSIACLKLLLTISKGTMLLNRCCVVSWTLLRSVFPDSIDIFTYYHGNIGMDPLWSTMISHVSTSLYYRQIQIELSNFGKSKNRCSVLFKSVFGVIESGLKATINPENFITKLFFLIWWYHEQSTHRLYGIASIIKEVFQRFLGVHFSHTAPLDNHDTPTKVTKTSARNRHVSTDTLSHGKVKNHGKVVADYVFNARGVDESPAYFAGMTNENVETFFISALSVIPLLFFNAHVDINTMSIDSGVTSPYKTLIFTSILYITTLRGITQAIFDGDIAKFLLRIILNCVKVCRATLDTIDYAALSAINWRNRSYRKVQTDDDAASVHSTDVGSIDYLAEALEWTLSCVQWTVRFTEVVQSKFLYLGAFAVSKSLLRSIPQLQVSAEKLAGRLHRYAKIYNVMLDEPENTCSAWELQLHDSIFKYKNYNSSYLSTNELKEDYLNALDVQNVVFEGDEIIDFNKSNVNDIDDNDECNDLFSRRFVDDDDLMDTKDELESFSGWGMFVHDEI